MIKYDIRKALIDGCKINPDKKAIVFKNQSVTYFELRNKVMALTAELKTLGVGKGDFVAIHMSNSIDMILSIFAIINCNAIVTPINIDLPHDQISRILTESNPKIMLYNKYVCPENHCGNIKTIYVDYTELNTTEEIGDTFIASSPNDLIYCIFTSGSSGIPKGVLLTQEGIMNHIEAKISLLKLTSDTRLCLSFNTGFVASIWQILTPILLGAQLFVYDDTLIKKPYQFFEQIERDKINVISMIPHSLYGYCQYIEGKHEKLQLLDMEQIILTGEKVDRVVVEKFYKNYDHISLINAYGQSECSDDTFHYIIPQNIALDDIPIGNPIQNVLYHILNENLKEVTCGEKGELYIGGACLSQCYLNNEQLTKEKFVNISGSIFYRTGDIVRLDEDQNTVCLGRVDNQIKIRGYRVEPEEIESYINQITDVKQSIVIALETNEIDKILGAFYTSESNINSKDIIDYLFEKLPEYMIPSVFKRVEEFIQNANGKIDRNRVLECVEIKSGDSFSDDSIEAKLSDIQKRAFKVINSTLDSKIGVVTLESGFANAGIDSITFITIVVALESEFDFEFDDEMLLITKFPTVKSMIEYVESKVI